MRNKNCYTNDPLYGQNSFYGWNSSGFIPTWVFLTLYVNLIHTHTRTRRHKKKDGKRESAYTRHTYIHTSERLVIGAAAEAAFSASLHTSFFLSCIRSCGVHSRGTFGRAFSFNESHASFVFEGRRWFYEWSCMISSSSFFLFHFYLSFFCSR